jgi:hypothetical protein
MRIGLESDWYRKQWNNAITSKELSEIFLAVFLKSFQERQKLINNK